MRPVVYVLWLALLGSAVVSAQETEAPDIYLPPVVLEVEDTGASRVSIPDPVIGEQEPGIPGVLIEAGSDEGDFQLLTQIPLIDPLDSEAVVSDKRFFSEGTIGVGTASRLYGNIELTQMSKQGPGFTAGFLHDASDGFYPHEAGKGFSQRDDSIYGTFVYLDDPLNLFVKGDVVEYAWGFQGLGDYIDVTRRGGSVYLEGSYTRDWFTATLTGDTLFLTQVFGGENSQSFDYNAITPRADFEGAWEYASAGVFALSRISQESLWEFGAYIGLTPFPWLGINGGVSLVGDEMLIPWHGGIEFSYFDGMNMEISGGRKVVSADPLDILSAAPMSPVKKAYPLESFWFIDTRLQLVPSDTVTISFEGETFLEREFNWLEKEIDTDGRLYFAAIPYDLGFGGRYTAAARYSTSLNWFMRAAYAVDIFSQDLPGMGNSLVLEGEYTRMPWGLVVAGSFEVPFGASTQLPVFDVSVEVPVGRGVSIEFRGSDLLSVTAEDPRPFIGNYQTKGFELSFFTNISL